MKLQVSAGAVLAVAGLAAAAFVAWRVQRQAQAWGETIGTSLSDGAAAVWRNVNPASPDNIVYSGVNAAGGAITGQGGDFSFGSWIYDITHPGEFVGPVAPRANTGGVTGSWDEPEPYLVDQMGNPIYPAA